MAIHRPRETAFFQLSPCLIFILYLLPLSCCFLYCFLIFVDTNRLTEAEVSTNLFYWLKSVIITERMDQIVIRLILSNAIGCCFLEHWRFTVQVKPLSLKIKYSYKCHFSASNAVELLLGLHCRIQSLSVKCVICKLIKVWSTIHFVFPSSGNFLRFFAISTIFIIGADWNTYWTFYRTWYLFFISKLCIFLVYFRYFREYFTNLSNLFTEITRILLNFTNLSDLFSKISLILVICLVKFH